MAQEFNIPGLKESLADLKKLNEAVLMASKNMLQVAINGEKAMKAVNNNGGVKDSINLQKTAKTETDKLQQAKDRLIKATEQEAKEIAKINLQIQEQISKNKILAAAENENATALQKFNAKVLESTKLSKELGANMALLAMEGKKNTQEYKELEKAFLKATETSSKLNESYRSISKTAGDNRALVGSYSEELEGHFQSINDSVSSLKGNIASGNYAGAFNDARTVVKGFGEAIAKTKGEASENNQELGKTTNVFTNLKTKVNDAGKATVEFFKPAEQHSAKMTQGLERIRIGFTQNRDAVDGLRASQTQGNAVGEQSNNINQRGSILSNLWARAQLILAGATGIASGAFGVLAVAIAATGIGAIIIAVALLISYLSKLDPVMDFIERAFAGLGGVIGFLEEQIGSFITNIKSVGDLMSKLGDIITHPIDSINKLSSGMKDAAESAMNLKQRQQDLADQQDIAAIKNKVQESDIARLMIQAKDRTKTDAERQKAFQDAEKLNDEIYKRNKANAAEAVNIAITEARKKHQLNGEMIKDLQDLDIVRANNLLNDGKISIESYDMLKEAFDKSVEVRNQYNERLDKITTKKNNDAEKADAAEEKRQKAAEDRAKKALDDQRKSMELVIAVKKMVLDNIISSYKQEENLEDANLAHIRAVSMEKQVIANLEMQKNKLGVKDKQDLLMIEQRGSEEIVKIKREESEQLRKVQMDNSKFELELYDLTHQSQLDGEKKLTDLLIAEEKKRLKESLELHRQGMREELNIDKELSDSKLKEMAKSNAKLTQNQLRYLQWLEKETIKTDKDIKKADSDLLESKVKNIETQVKTEDRKFKLLGKGATANAKNEIANEKKELLAKRELYKGNADKIAEIDLQLAENQQKLDDLVKQNKIDALNQGFNSLVEVAGKESAVGKAAAIAQATMNTYLAITKTLSAFPGPVGIALSVLTGVAGFLQVAKIAGIQAFATGTNNAPYTGQAIVDEEGAEIHTDKQGRIKSFGQAGGARLENITKGDRIIPADISAMIKGTLYAKSIGKGDVIDYDKIGEQFGKHAGKIVGAINNKKESNFSVVVQKNITDRVRFKKRNV